MQKSETKLTPPHQRMSRLRQIFQHGDLTWQTLIILMSVLVLATMFAIGWMLWHESSVGRTTFGWSFINPFGDNTWDPVGNHFNSWPMIYGTLITSLVAIILALPLGLGVAIFLAELCPHWLRTPLGLMVELLAAIPSVVYGLWGIFIFLPVIVTPIGTFLGNSLGVIPGFSTFFAGPIPVSGASRLAAGLVLTIMIVPTVAAVSRDVFLAIPGSQREASLAMGATQWETISRVLIPYGLSGILGAVILGLGRALGETMAVTMVVGNSPKIAASLFAPGYSIAAVIANEFTEATGDLYLQSLVYLGLVLFLLTFLLNGMARLLILATTQKGSKVAA